MLATRKGEFHLLYLELSPSESHAELHNFKNKLSERYPRWFPNSNAIHSSIEKKKGKRKRLLHSPTVRGV